jgi:hypothetical protein
MPMNKLLLLILLSHLIVCQGFSQSGDLRITYDANQGVSGLAGANKVYMYSGAVTSGPSGQWEWIVGSPNLDDGIGLMDPLGSGLWTICIDPMSYYSSGVAGPIPGGATIYAIDLFFRNETGTAFGYNFSGSYMIIDMTTNPPSSNFPGLTLSNCAVGSPEVQLKDFVMNNFPNPLKTSTQITFNLKEDARKASITLFDMLGQPVKKFVWNDLKPGITKVNWNGDNDKGTALKNGIYFYTLEVDGVKMMSKRMVISR